MIVQFLTHLKIFYDTPMFTFSFQKDAFLLLIDFFQCMIIIDKDVNKYLYIRTIGRKCARHRMNYVK